jgi:hypothetical protein
MRDDIPKAPKTPRVSYSDDPSSVRISVQCNADSHADRPWLIDSFVLDSGDDASTSAPIWVGSSTYWRDGKSIAQLTIDGSRATLVDDRVISREDRKADPFVLDNGSRSRYSFKCGICGLSLARKGPAITACFDRLVAAGVSEVSLEGLILITK